MNLRVFVVLVVSCVPLSLFGAPESESWYAIEFYTWANVKLATGTMHVHRITNVGSQIDAEFCLELVPGLISSPDTDMFQKVFHGKETGKVGWTKDPNANPGSQNAFAFEQSGDATQVGAWSGDPAVLDKGESNGIWFFVYSNRQTRGGGFFTIQPTCAPSIGMTDKGDSTKHEASVESAPVPTAQAR